MLCLREAMPNLSKCEVKVVNSFFDKSSRKRKVERQTRSLYKQKMVLLSVLRRRLALIMNPNNTISLSPLSNSCIELRTSRISSLVNKLEQDEPPGPTLQPQLVSIKELTFVSSSWSNGLFSAYDKRHKHISLDH